jgi:uncharacterized protein CbrC (UPF0167 family)
VPYETDEQKQEGQDLRRERERRNQSWSQGHPTGGISEEILVRARAADLPHFIYHPDPLQTGSLVESDEPCVCCGESRGYIYTGPVFGAEDELDNCICPWCITDGSAYRKFRAEFTDGASIQASGRWEAEPKEVPENVIDEIAYRTPGFTGWQQEQWATHCGDGCLFLGRMGHQELRAVGQPAIDAIRDDVGIEDENKWEEFFYALAKNDSPTAYLFQCRHCQAYLGYTDCD